MEAEGLYLNGQVTVLTGRGELLDVPVDFSHRQAAVALLPAADNVFQSSQHPLQFWVQVTARICEFEQSVLKMQRSEEPLWCACWGEPIREGEMARVHPVFKPGSIFSKVADIAWS